MTTSTHVDPYPCDRGFGDGTGRGLHSFTSGHSGVVCCMYCGKRPQFYASEPAPKPWQPWRGSDLRADWPPYTVTNANGYMSAEYTEQR